MEEGMRQRMHELELRVNELRAKAQRLAGGELTPENDWVTLAIPSAIYPELGHEGKRLAMLVETIAQLRHATMYPHRIVVVDNGHSDVQTKVLAGFVRSGVIDHVILNSENWGSGGAEDQAFRLTNSYWVCTLSNDLKFERGWLTECVEALKATKSGEWEDEQGEACKAKAFVAVSNAGHHANKWYKVGRVNWAAYGSIIEWRVNNRGDSFNWVMARFTYNMVGSLGWFHGSETQWANAAHKLGIRWIVAPKPKVFHVGGKSEFVKVRDQVKHARPLPLRGMNKI